MQADREALCAASPGLLLLLGLLGAPQGTVHTHIDEVQVEVSSGLKGRGEVVCHVLLRAEDADSCLRPAPGKLLQVLAARRCCCCGNEIQNGLSGYCFGLDV